MTSNIEVLICTRDRPDTLGQAVESVVACDDVDVALHVLDQSTTDASERVVRAIAAAHPDRAVHYHHLAVPGLSRAYNAGAATTAAPIIACTDDDVIVPRNWLRAIGDAFGSDPELGLLYGQVLEPPALQDLSEVVLPSLEWAEPLRLHRRDRNFKVWGMGANMAFRRSAFEQVGGFDEVLGGGAPLRSSQDFDFALRVYRAGWAVLLDPTVTVDHYGTRTVDQWIETIRNYGIGDGAYLSKHVRCRDPLAAKILAAKFLRMAGSLGKRSVRARRPIVHDAYAQGVVTGIREGMRFGVDCDRRLYVETETAKIVPTAANTVTGVVREG
jgi:GT2 family glycosyltransferase